MNYQRLTYLLSSELAAYYAAKHELTNGLNREIPIDSLVAFRDDQGRTKTGRVERPAILGNLSVRLDGVDGKPGPLVVVPWYRLA